MERADDSAVGQDWNAGEPEFVSVAGSRIAFRHLPAPAPASASAPGKPRVLLIHGGAAHVGWWIDVVPLLRDKCELIVIELSGHGDSEHREHYSLTGWAAEGAAVIAATGGAPAHVVGHSLGGVVALALSAGYPALVASLLVIDSILGRRTEDGRSLARAVVHHYASEEEAVAHFRLVPPGTLASPQTLAAVARIGLRHDPAGWTWKFDRSALGRVEPDFELADTARVRCPLHFVYGEHSVIANAEVASALAAAAGREVPSQMVPGAYHHIPLDAPDATADAIRSLW